MRFLSLLLAAAAALPALAQVPYLVRDINTGHAQDTGSSQPDEFTAFGNRVFFVVTTPETGRELWSTDGNGASLVADIAPGGESSSPSDLLVFGNQLFFTARTAQHGTELWVTNGTAAGTRLFADLYPGSESSFPFGKMVHGNRMLFAATNAANGRELWSSDGTAAGTAMIADAAPGTGSLSPVFLTPFNGAIYFAAANGLWKTDGTAGGTVRVHAGSELRSLTVAGSQLFYDALTDGGREPWVSDGTDAGTRVIEDIHPGPIGSLDAALPSGFVALGDEVIFLARDPEHGRELWISNGTAEGTRILHDGIEGPEGYSTMDPMTVVAFKGRVFFPGKDDAHGGELWVTDGTDAGTMLFADLTPGSAPSAARPVVVHEEKLYFLTSGASGFWVTDGTVAGTRLINAQTPYTVASALPRSVAGRLYFAARTELTGTEPWVTDGTAAGTHMVANLAADSAPSSNPKMFTAAGGLLFFYAIEGPPSPQSGIAEWSLWRSDGTAAGTFKLWEAGQHPPSLHSAGGFVLFKEAVNGTSWMVTDGTVAGTKRADDFLARFGGEVRALWPFGAALFAEVGDSRALWGTTAVAGAPAAFLGAYAPFGFYEAAGRSMFLAGTHEAGLWSSDGTPAGTYAVVPDLGVQSFRVGPPVAHVGGTIWFHSDGTLWKSDGTFDGTQRVLDVPQGGGAVVAAGRRVFFEVGGGLWMNDVAQPGGVQVPTVSELESQELLVAAGERVVFTRRVAGNERELWGSDGTPAGTRRLMTAGRVRGDRTGIEGLVYFAGSDQLHGTEPWVTDGTPEGTRMLFDVNPGPAGSDPEGFTKVGNTVYFSANSVLTGRELWAFDLDGARLSIGDARIAEGGTVRLTVSLAAAQGGPVTVGYATEDGSAAAGQDYEAASGTLTFAAGETSRTIDVRVLADSAAERDEELFVVLRDAAGGRIAKSHGAAVIGDDDRTVDLSAVLAFDGNLHEHVTVSNDGPSGATDIVVSKTSAPGLLDPSSCAACRIPQLAAGARVDAAFGSSSPFGQAYFSAVVTARQPDAQPSNNAVTWTVGALRWIAMTPAWLRPGATATLRARVFGTTTTPTVTLSDPSVISVSSPVPDEGSDTVSLTVTALKAGTSKVIVATPATGQLVLLVTVLEPGQSMRFDGGVELSLDTGMGLFDSPFMVKARPVGTALITGARATGTVTVEINGQEVARHALDGSELRIPVYPRVIGTNVYRIRYSGDANFLPHEYAMTLQVGRGRTTLTGTLARTPEEALTLTVRAVGSPLAAPGGNVFVTAQNGQRLSSGVLQPSGEGTSVAQLLLPNLPPSTTLTIHYEGDARYQQGSQQVRVPATSRSRSVRH
jgi:ELWxxDGT repeat protein